MRQTFAGLFLLLSVACLTTAATAKPTPHNAPKMVAYDAKDKRFYSVAWAKAHGMHDKGGDLLTIVPLSSLPAEAKLSKQMHGKL